jgi:hypothetical protein
VPYKESCGPRIGSPIASEALARIAALYEIEKGIRLPPASTALSRLGP